MHTFVTMPSPESPRFESPPNQETLPPAEQGLNGKGSEKNPEQTPATGADFLQAEQAIDEIGKLRREESLLKKQLPDAMRGEAPASRVAIENRLARIPEEINARAGALEQLKAEKGGDFGGDIAAFMRASNELREIRDDISQIEGKIDEQNAETQRAIAPFLKKIEELEAPIAALTKEQIAEPSEDFRIYEALDKTKEEYRAETEPEINELKRQIEEIRNADKSTVDLFTKLADERKKELQETGQAQEALRSKYSEGNAADETTISAGAESEDRLEKAKDSEQGLLLTILSEDEKRVFSSMHKKITDAAFALKRRLTEEGYGNIDVDTAVAERASDEEFRNYKALNEEFRALEEQLKEKYADQLADKLAQRTADIRVAAELLRIQENARRGNQNQGPNQARQGPSGDQDISRDQTRAA